MPRITSFPDGKSTVYAHTIGDSNKVFATITLTPAGTGTSIKLRSPTQGGYYAKTADALRSRL